MIVLYGKTDCNYCDLAKQYLESRNITFQYVTTTPDIVQMLHENFSPSIKTVPVVVVDGAWIGGYSELMSYINENYTIEGNKTMQILKG